MSSAKSKRKLVESADDSLISSRSEFLNRKLLERPERDRLVEQGILPKSQCAPSLHQAEKSLKRARLQDELNSRLCDRPGPLDLIQKNILHVDPSQETSQLEKAIQTGQISFQSNRQRNMTRRRLIFHEYTDSPSSSKAKVTKVENLDETPVDSHQIRLAQQKLLLELISNQSNDSLPAPADRQETAEEEIELFSPSELEEILRSFGPTMFIDEKDKLLPEFKFDLEMNYPLEQVDRQDDDDLFIELLLNDGPSSSICPTKDLPRITNLDEFDAFLRDFNKSTSSNRVLLPSSTNNGIVFE